MKNLMKHFKTIHRTLVPMCIWENPAMAEAPRYNPERAHYLQRKRELGRTLEQARQKWPWAL